jgi:hypothetical protein
VRDGPVADSLHRFSERDLMMRYYWGLGVGHFYVHQTAATTDCVLQIPEDTQAPDSEQEELLGGSDNDASNYVQDGDSEVYDSDNPELGLDDRQSDEWGEDGDESDGDDRDEDENMEDEYYTGM